MKNRIIEIYNKISKKYYSIRENMALIPEIDRLCSLLPKGGCLLDAGCGNGRDLVIFKSKGLKATGIDLSDGQLDIAKRRVEDQDIILQKQDILHLSFPENSFDGIWCCAVLSHYRHNDFIQIVKKFHDILRTNGYCCLVIKKGRGEEMVIENEFDGIVRFTTYYSEDDIFEIARRTNFAVIDIYAYNEKERFQSCNRNLNFLVIFLKKIDK